MGLRKQRHACEDGRKRTWGRHGSLEVCAETIQRQGVCMLTLCLYQSNRRPLPGAWLLCKLPSAGRGTLLLLWLLLPLLPLLRLLLPLLPLCSLSQGGQQRHQGSGRNRRAATSPSPRASVGRSRCRCLCESRRGYGVRRCSWVFRSCCRVPVCPCRGQGWLGRRRKRLLRPGYLRKAALHRTQTAAACGQSGWQPGWGALRRGQHESWEDAKSAAGAAEAAEGGRRR